MCRLQFASSCPEHGSAASLPLVLNCEGLAPGEPFPPRSRQFSSTGTDHRPGRSKVRPLHKPDPSRPLFPISSRHSSLACPQLRGATRHCSCTAFSSRSLARTQEGSLFRNSFVSPSYRDSLVSPLFPLDTKIEGGGGAKHFVTPARSLKLFKNFQANSFLCRVFSFFRGEGGVC